MTETSLGEEPDTPYVDLPFETGNSQQKNIANGNANVQIGVDDRGHDRGEDGGFSEPFGVGIKEDG